jgi:hypothetical protein
MPDTTQAGEPAGVQAGLVGGQGRLLSVESTINQINHRMKGTEKFWLEGGAEALLQVRTGYLSEDDRTQRYWSRPRPYDRSAGQGRLRPAA